MNEFRLKELGKIPGKLKPVRLAELTECATKDQDINGDGGCTWGRTYAQKTGKYSGLNASRSLDRAEEIAKLMKVREVSAWKDRKIDSSEKAVMTLLRSEAEKMNEVFDFCQEAEIEEALNSETLQFWHNENAFQCVKIILRRGHG